MAPHSACTATAASSAAFPSSGVASATSQSGSSVAGSITGKVAPPRGVAPLASDGEPLLDLLDDLLFLCRYRHAASF